MFFFNIMENQISEENIRNLPFHGRLLSLIHVCQRTLLCTALLLAPCACAVAAPI